MDLRDLDGVSGWALSAHGGEGRGAVGGIGDVVDVVWGVEVLAIPAAEVIISISMYCQLIQPVESPHMGKMTLDRHPPGHGLLGNPSVSRTLSKHGE